MDSSGIRPAEWVAALGGVLLLIALFFLDWYSLEPSIAPLEIGASFLTQVQPPTEIPGLPMIEANLGAWDEQGFLGTIANLVMLAAGVWAIVAVALRAGVASVEMGMDSATVTAVLGVAAAVMVLLRMVFPVDEISGLGFDASLKVGIFIALAGAILIALAGLMSRGAAPVAPAGPPAGGPPPPPPPSEPPAPPSGPGRPG